MDLYTVQYIVYAAGLILCALGFFAAMRRPPTEEQKLVMAVEFFAFLILFGYWGGMQNKHASLDLLVFANKIEYIGSCNVFVVLMLLYFRYFHKKMPSWLYWMQVGISLGMTLLTVTADNQKLYYKSYHIENLNGVNLMIKEYGPLHKLYVIFIAAYTLAFLFLFVFAFIHETKEDRKNNIVLSCAVLLPPICYLIEKLFHIKSFYITPLGITVTGLANLYLLIIRKFCDVKCIAQNLVFDSIDDAIVIIDNRYHLQQYNKSAEKLFPFFRKFYPDERINNIDSQFELIFAPAFNIKTSYPVDWKMNGEIYFPEIKNFSDASGNKAGSILWLKNITAEREKEKILSETNNRLEEMVAKKTSRIYEMQDKMMIAFATLLETRNVVTGKHLRRTGRYVRIIAEEMRKEHMFADTITDSWIQTLSKVAPLHDIGKITTPEAVLDKPGKLTEEEFELMKRHTLQGAAIIQYTLKDNVDDDFYYMASDVAQYHHEWWNGCGYPEGLAGEKIPLSARIVAVADVFDALVTVRPYKSAFSIDDAFRIISGENGTHFDPYVAQAFLDSRTDIEKTYREFED